MKFFFDESGRFALTRSKDHHSAAVVMGVVVSEIIEAELKADFEAFADSLSEEEKNNGEPKGSLLKVRSRSDFCDLLDRYGIRGIMLTPIVMDMTSITEKKDYFTPPQMQASLEKFSEICRTEEIAESYREFGRRFGSLSLPQAWKVFAWTAGFMEAIEHAVLFFCSNGHEDCWEDVRFEVDAVGPRGAGVEEDIFSKMVFMWLTGWTRDRSALIQEIHTPDHPFVKRYGSNGGIDLVKLLWGKIHFVESRESWGVQIADIASNIVFRAAHDLECTKGDMYIYASLMRSSPYGKCKGPGLVDPTSEKTMNRELLTKYNPMFEILNRRAPLHL